MGDDRPACWQPVRGSWKVSHNAFGELFSPASQSSNVFWVNEAFFQTTFSNTPPLTSITRREAMLSSSHVRRSLSRPTLRAIGRVCRNISVHNLSAEGGRDGITDVSPEPQKKIIQLIAYRYSSHNYLFHGSTRNAPGTKFGADISRATTIDKTHVGRKSVRESKRNAKS